MVQSRLTVVALPLDEANLFVARHHRHHVPVVGHKFSMGVADEHGEVRGVAIIGRPVSRGRDNGLTLEVTRLATDGCPNACSALYAAAWRATRALGYERLGTYTLSTEPGTSLRAAGWHVVGQVTARSWSCPSRPRVDKTPLQGRLLWEPVACGQMNCPSCGLPQAQHSSEMRANCAVFDISTDAPVAVVETAPDAAPTPPSAPASGASISVASVLLGWCNDIKRELEEVASDGPVGPMVPYRVDEHTTPEQLAALEKALGDLIRLLFDLRADVGAAKDAVRA